MKKILIVFLALAAIITAVSIFSETPQTNEPGEGTNANSSSSPVIQYELARYELFEVPEEREGAVFTSHVLTHSGKNEFYYEVTRGGQDKKMDIIRGEIFDNQGTLSYIARNIREDHNESNINVGDTVFTAQKNDDGLEIIEWISVKPLLETSSTIPEDEYGS